MVAHHNIDQELIKKDKGCVLIVEDDPMEIDLLKPQIDTLGYSILTAINGQNALEILQKNRHQIDTVLMDREMPIMNGLNAVKHIKNDPELRTIPIIMVTGAASASNIKEGIDAGVFYYLTKPFEENVLCSILSAAIRDFQRSKTLSKELGKHKASFELIETAKFSFRTLSEAESLAAFIANCFPDPQRTLPGLGELLINAVEHGNLGVGYAQKTKLIESGTWRSEIDYLQKLPHYKNKKATATISHKKNGIYVIIEDQGDGFAWKNFLNIDPARAGDNHGRGIAQANTISFDQLTYNDKGNQAVAFVGHQSQLEW